MGTGAAKASDFTPSAAFAVEAEHQAPQASLLEHSPPYIAVVAGHIQRVGVDFVNFDPVLSFLSEAGATFMFRGLAGCGNFRFCKA